MQASGQTFFDLLMAWLHSPGTVDAMQGLLMVLVLVNIFLLWTWLRLQPQAYFLHLILASSFVLLYLFYSFLPIRFKLWLLVYLDAAPYTKLAFYLLVLFWLATTSLGYRKSRPDRTLRQVLQQRQWAMLLSLVFVLLVALIDASGQRLPWPNQLLFAWGVPTLAALVLAVVSGAQNFREVKSEWVLYLLIIGAVIASSYLGLFRSLALALLPAIFAAAAMILLVLSYHRRFVGLEAELRRGLYDETVQLREQNAIKDDMLRLTREAILHIDRDERIKYANPTFMEITRLEAGDLLNKRLREVVSRQFYEATAPALKDVRLGRKGTFEIILHREGKPDIAMHAVVKPLLDSRRKLRGFHLGFFDFSEHIAHRRNLQAKLQTQQHDLELYRAALEKADDAIVVTDSHGRILFVNSAFSSMTGFSYTKLRGQSCTVYRADAAAERIALNHLQQAKIWRGSWQNLRKDGSEFMVDVSAVPIVEDDGAVVYIVWTERDAEARVQLQEALAEAKSHIAEREQEVRRLDARYKSILTSLDTGIVLVRPDGACRYLNETAGSLLGFKSDEISIRVFPPFIKELLKLDASYGDKVHAEATEYVDRFRRPDGSVKILKWRAVPLAPGNGKRIGTLLQLSDVTELHAAQQRLQELDEVFASVEQTQADELRVKLLRLQTLLDLSENIPVQGDLAKVLESIAQAAHQIGWPRMMLFKKSPAQQYQLTVFSGFSKATADALAKLPAEDVEQYFQVRFAVSASYFLRANKKTAAKMPVFIPKNVKMPASGEWSEDILLVPLVAKGKRIGLFLCGAPADGALPNEQKVQELERLATLAALSLEREQQRQQQHAQAKKDRLIIEISKEAHFDNPLEQELRRILKLTMPVLNSPVCVLLAGDDAFGLFARAQRKAVKIDTLEAEAAENILTEVSDHVPPTGAAVLPMRPDFRAMRHSLNLDPTKQPAFLFLAPLIYRNKRLGAFCSFRDKSEFQPEDIDFVSELAARIALVVENSRLFADVENKAQELERANTLISEFLSNVSHELRTPLHTILSYVELLRQQLDASAELRLQHLQTIHNSGNKLLRLISDLLDLSKIEAGKVEPVLEVFDPRELVREIEREIAPMCRQSGLELHVSIDNSLPPAVRSDRQLLARVLLNLARNAQKFTHRGAVILRAEFQQPDLLRLEVQDTGIGIPKDALQEIFKPFHQVDRKTTRRYEGSGLGLPISKRIVELLQGEMRVKSRDGRGSTFTIEVPVQAMKRRPAKSKEAMRPGQNLPKRKSAKRSQQILLVDDDKSTLEATKYLLENAGYRVELASDGHTAISLAQHLRPDLILLDIMMPGMDGYQVMRTLKSQKQLQRIPIIALTARAMSDDQQKAREAGCDEVLTKPFAMDEFFATIERHLNGNGN